MSVWSIWQRWFGKKNQQETIHDEGRGVHAAEHEENRGVHAAEHDEGQLRAELRRLEHQRQTIEQRGCFSDRELEEKDLEIDRLDRRIKEVKSQQFHLRTYGKSGSR